MQEVLKQQRIAREIIRWGKQKQLTVPCENAEKEEQMSRDCGHKGHEWYEDLMKHFLEWGKNNPIWITRDGNKKPAVSSDTVVTEECFKDVCLKTLESDNVNGRSWQAGNIHLSDSFSQDNGRIQQGSITRKQASVTPTITKSVATKMRKSIRLGTRRSDLIPWNRTVARYKRTSWRP